MLDPSIIFELFIKVVRFSLALDSEITVIQGELDTETDFPLVAVASGPVITSDLTKQSQQNDFTVNVDVYLRSSEKNYFKDITGIIEKIKRGLSSSRELAILPIFKIELQQQSEPNRSAEGVEYSSHTRLEWLIEYHTER